MPTRYSKQVKLPVEVYQRLKRLAGEYQDAYELHGKARIMLFEGRGAKEPTVPIHAVITKALDQMEAHRKRSRKKK